MLPDTGRYLPSPGQLWLWENWLDFWGRVRAQSKHTKARVIGLHMGDSVDGDHHRSTQLITLDPEAQAYIRDHALLPMRQACGKIYVCRGTEAHVGPGQDDACGRWLKAERHPDSEGWAAHQWDLVANGVRIQARHHWNMGGLPWTRYASIVRLAHQIFTEAADYAVRKNLPLTYPDVALRGHMHRWADSGTAQPVRAIGVPAWQLATSFVHRISQLTLSDIGGLTILCTPDGEYEVTKCLYTPEPESVVRV